MRLDRVKPGDRVEANVKGRTFIAPVTEVGKGEVFIDPPRGFTWRRLAATQVLRKVA